MAIDILANIGNFIVTGGDRDISTERGGTGTSDGVEVFVDTDTCGTSSVWNRRSGDVHILVDVSGSDTGDFWWLNKNYEGT